MRPNKGWKSDWKKGLSPEREWSIAGELLEVFESFWNDAGLEEKSKSTRQRYSGGLHALGGYIVDLVAESEELSGSARQLILEETQGDEGPLIHQDRHEWQRELDTVCRKLRKYLLQEG